MKLRRFLRLCQNEWTKIFSRLTVYIMIAVLFLIALGFGFINKQSQGYNHYGAATMEKYEKNWKTYVNSEINQEKQYLEQYIKEGYADHTQWHKYFFRVISASPDYDMLTFYDEYISGLEYILAKEIRSDDWRLGALEAIAVIKSRAAVLESGSKEYTALSAEIDSFWRAITDNSWKEYLDLELNSALFKSLRKISEDDINEDVYKETVRIRKAYNIKPYLYPYSQDYIHYTESWQETELSEYQSNYNTIVTKFDIQGNPVAEKDLGPYKEALKLSEFRFENDSPPLLSNTAGGHVASSAGLTIVIALCLIVLAGNLVASEYTSGTIKLLLISPHKRWKILLSKYAVLFVVAVIMLILVLIFSVLSGAIFFGFTGMSSVAVKLLGSYVELPVVVLALLKYLLRLPELLVMTSLAVMLAVIMRHSAVAIGVGSALVFGGAILTELLRFIPYDWKRFLLQANTDLSVYFPSLSVTDIFGNGATAFLPDMTFLFSILVLGGYFLCINYIALDSFYRRDIK